MALYTKCILKKKEGGDGVRISVMSRHTKNDGVTPDTRIVNDSFDKHYPELAPSPKLLGDYYKRNLSWEAFEARFKKQLQEAPTQALLKEIAALAISNNVTLMCIEDTPEFCHRRLLLEECARLSPGLATRHH